MISMVTVPSVKVISMYDMQIWTSIIIRKDVSTVFLKYIKIPIPIVFAEANFLVSKKDKSQREPNMANTLAEQCPSFRVWPSVSHNHGRMWRRTGVYDSSNDTLHTQYLNQNVLSTISWIPTQRFPSTVTVQTFQ